MKTVLAIAATAATFAATTAAPSASHAARRSCPVPDSGTCLGVLGAGAYSSKSFRPKVTFTVPDGWSNYLDVPGLYLLMPPGAKPPGNNIVGNFIGVEWAVAPEAMDCSSPVRGVNLTPQAIGHWIAKNQGLVVTNRHSVTVGGLNGIALDVRMRPHAKGCLSSGATTPAIPLLVGVGPAQFDHEVAPGYAERHWLLAYKGRTLEIQAVDASGGSKLAGLATIVRTFRFTASRT